MCKKVYEWPLLATTNVQKYLGLYSVLDIL